MNIFTQALVALVLLVFIPKIRAMENNRRKKITAQAITLQKILSENLKYNTQIICPKKQKISAEKTIPTAAASSASQETSQPMASVTQKASESSSSCSLSATTSLSIGLPPLAPIEMSYYQLNEILDEVKEIFVKQAKKLPTTPKDERIMNRVKILRYFSGLTPLHFAIEREDADLISYLLKFYPELINTKNTQKITPLHRAAQGSDSAIFKLILNNSNPLAIRSLNYQGDSPLHNAMLKSNPAIISELLEAYPEAAQIKNFDGNLPLHIAARHGHKEAVASLLKIFPEGASVQNSDGNIPLHLASLEGHCEAAKLLLEQNPSTINLKNNSGETPLHLSIEWHRDATLICLLFDYNANLKIKNGNGESFIDLLNNHPLLITDIKNQFLRKKSDLRKKRTTIKTATSASCSGVATLANGSVSSLAAPRKASATQSAFSMTVASVSGI